MPAPATLLVFVLAASVLVAIPGPNHLYIVTRSIAQGRRGVPRRAPPRSLRVGARPGTEGRQSAMAVARVGRRGALTLVARRAGIWVHTPQIPLS